MNLELKTGKYIRTKRSVDEFSLYDEYLRVLCSIEHIYLSDSERSLLVYYIIHGVNFEAEKKYIKEYGRTKQAVSNLKYQLLQKGMLNKVEESGGHEVIQALKTKRDELTIIIELIPKTND